MAKEEPTLDISRGSPMGDLFIHPLSVLFQENLDFEDKMLNNLSLKNELSMEEEEIEEIAANFLVTREPGAKATGFIRLFYNAAISMNLPIGTLFESDTGYKYQTTGAFAITRQMMMVNNDFYPLFHTGDIAIEAIGAGEGYIALADTIRTSVGTLSPQPSTIRNLQAVINAKEREDNTALKTKIINSVTNKSVASPDGIKRVLQEVYPNITSLVVKGHNDAEMIRDISYSGITIGDIYTSDYNYKISGMYSYPNNESIAYVGRFQDTDETTVISLPTAPSDFTGEFTNDMYNGLYKDDDPTYAELGVYNVLEEYFNDQTTSTGYNLLWVASDGQASKGSLVNPDEITVDSQAIKLGINEEPDSNIYKITSAKPKVTINVDEFNAVLENIRDLIDKDFVDIENVRDGKGDQV